jgi:hypothetical protein
MSRSGVSKYGARVWCAVAPFDAHVLAAAAARSDPCEELRKRIKTRG